MEEKSRLEQFKEFVELDPSDTFSRYALAMEYMGISEFGEAVRHFEAVIANDPAYAVAYFQAAIASEKLSKVDQAITLVKQGIQVAENNRDWHARDEMKEFLKDLESRRE